MTKRQGAAEKHVQSLVQEFSLARCPHCDGEGVTEHVTFKNPDQNRCAIVCKNCGAYGGPALGGNKTAVQCAAIALWNNRPDIRNETIKECVKFVSDWGDNKPSGMIVISDQIASAMAHALKEDQ